MNKKTSIILLIILLAGAFLLFFRLTRQDMLGDDAHYAFRALGSFDYMASEEQTTPIQWLGERPAWTRLSFHDHPPLVFWIQHIVFKLFGSSVWSARLLSVLAALVTLVLVYLIGRQIKSSQVGLFSSGALLLNNYFIWTGRIGLLESLFACLAVAGLLFTLKSLAQPKFWPWAFVFWGLSFLAKYTFLFIAPALIIFILVWHRPVLRRREFWIGVLLFLIISSPVLIYNLKMYQVRGHFDVQFADLLRQEHQDWTKLSGRISQPNYNIFNTFGTIASGWSWPYFVVAMLALIYGIVLARRKSALRLPILISVSLMLMFTLVGSAPRWLGVISPFVAIILGVVVSDLWAQRPKLRYVVAPVLALTIAFSLVYLWNTNHALSAPGTTQLFSKLRIESYGYNQLDQEIGYLVAGKQSPLAIRNAVWQWWYKDFAPEVVPFRGEDDPAKPQFRSMIVYDSNSTWFPIIWTFERRKLYNGYLIFSSEEYLKAARSNDVETLNQLGLDGVYFIQSLDLVRRVADTRQAETDLITKNFADQGIKPQIIRNIRGEEAFAIYYGRFK